MPEFIEPPADEKLRQQPALETPEDGKPVGDPRELFSYALSAKNVKAARRSHRKLERAALVAHMWVRHQMATWEIAKRLGISTVTVHKCLEEIREVYRDVCKVNYEDYLSKEIAQLEMVKREAWRGWERSLENAEKVEQKASAGETGESGNGSPGIEVKRTTEGQSGNPAMLQAVMKASQQIVEMFDKIREAGGKGKGDGYGTPYGLIPVVIANRTEAGEAMKLEQFKHQFTGYSASGNGEAEAAETIDEPQPTQEKPKRGRPKGRKDSPGVKRKPTRRTGNGRAKGNGRGNGKPK